MQYTIIHAIKQQVNVRINMTSLSKSRTLIESNQLKNNKYSKFENRNYKYRY